MYAHVPSPSWHALLLLLLLFIIIIVIRKVQPAHQHDGQLLWQIPFDELPKVELLVSPRL